MENSKKTQKNELGNLQAQGTRGYFQSFSQETKQQKQNSIYNKCNKNLNGESEYFYPNGYSNSSTAQNEVDEMNSLVSLSSYNRLMFGLR